MRIEHRQSLINEAQYGPFAKSPYLPPADYKLNVQLPDGGSAYTFCMGKYLLRRAFEADHILPDEILWRQKAAFSDAVGHSMVDDLKAYAEALYTDTEFENKRMRYDFARPFTKESLLYREIFEKYYPGQASMESIGLTREKCSGAKVGMPPKRNFFPGSQIVSPMEKMPGSKTPMMSPA